MSHDFKDEMARYNLKFHAKSYPYRTSSFGGSLLASCFQVTFVYLQKI